MSVILEYRQRFQLLPSRPAQVQILLFLVDAQEAAPQQIYLNLVNNEVFEPELDDYYHYYHLVHEEHTEKVIDGLHLVFVELPKFTPHTFTEKKMHVLWLRYLTEIDENTKEIPAELLANPEIAKAVSEIVLENYTDGELYSYEIFWDMVSVEKTLAGRLERLTKANDGAKRV